MLKFALIFFFISTCIYGQSIYNSDKYYGTLAELYLHRQASPKAEAMGMGMAANNEEGFGANYNPALTSLGSGLNINASFSSAYYLATESKFNYFGASYSNKKLGSFGLSRYFWTLGEPTIITTETGAELGTVDTYSTSLYTLNYSREIIDNLFAGVNLGLAHINFPVSSPAADYPVYKDAYTLDLGLLKRIPLESSSKNLTQFISFGASAMNITSSSIKATYQGSEEKNLLPVILRLAGSYNVKIKGNSLIPGGNIFESLTHIEYRNVTNSDYYKTFSFGEELILSDIFIARFGYFTQSVGEESVYNEGKQSKFTYGAGVKIPLNRIFEMKNSLNLNIDYVNMTPPSFSKMYTNWDNFQTLGITLKYVP
jgi:hypothetical protein